MKTRDRSSRIFPNSLGWCVHAFESPANFGFAVLADLVDPPDPVRWDSDETRDTRIIKDFSMKKAVASGTWTFLSRSCQTWSSSLSWTIRRHCKKCMENAHWNTLNINISNTSWHLDRLVRQLPRPGHGHNVSKPWGTFRRLGWINETHHLKQQKGEGEKFLASSFQWISRDFWIFDRTKRYFQGARWPSYKRYLQSKLSRDATCAAPEISSWNHPSVGLRSCAAAI